MCHIDYTKNDEPSVVYRTEIRQCHRPYNHTRQVSCQKPYPAPWIFELRHLFKLIKHSRRNTLVELRIALSAFFVNSIHGPQCTPH